MNAPGSEREVSEMAVRVVRGEVAAEDYFAVVDRRAARLVDREVWAAMWRRRPWRVDS